MAWALRASSMRCGRLRHPLWPHSVIARAQAPYHTLKGAILPPFNLCPASHRYARRDPDHPTYGPAPPASHSRSQAPLADTSLERWRRSEQPASGAGLSAADRAVLALVRALADLADKSAADRAAAAHGLSLVTSSDVALRPLLPPFGSTLDEDGEAGDGMALAAPPLKAGRGPQEGPFALAEGPSALLGAMLAPSVAASSAFASPSNNSKDKPRPQRQRQYSDSGVGREAGGWRVSGMTAAATAAMARAASGAIAYESNDAYGDHQDHQDHHHRHHHLRDRGTNSAATLHRLSVLVEDGGIGGEEEGVQTDAEETGIAYGGGATYGAPAAAVLAGGGGGAVRHPATGPGMADTAAAALARVAKAASATAAAATAAAARPAAPAGRAVVQAATAVVSNMAKLTAQALTPPDDGSNSSSWLVADDPWGGVRYIAIAAGGELGRASPRDLTTDLVTFESYSLGAKVNRRLYAEAVLLYGRFMPLVMDFLETHPEGAICFGGEGVGGGLAVLLQLMAVHRGLRFARLVPAVAVGAPPVLAQVPRDARLAWGPTGREQQRAMHQDELEDVLEDLMSRSVLEELGLPQDAIHNIMTPPPLPSRMPGSGRQPPALLPSKTTTTVQATPASRPGAPEPLLVMAAAHSGRTSGSSGGGGAASAARGRAAGASTDPAGAQLFRLVGKIVHVDTAADGSTRPAPTTKTATTATRGAAIDGGGAIAKYSVNNTVDETDQMAAAAIPGGRGGGGDKRLDVATVSSIAGAAAAAAALAATRQLRHVGAGAARAATVGKGAAVAAAAAASSAASAGRGLATAVVASAALKGKGMATTVAASAASAGKGAATAAASVAAVAASTATAAGRRVVSAAAATPAAVAAVWGPAGWSGDVAVVEPGTETDGDDDMSVWGV